MICKRAAFVTLAALAAWAPANAAVTISSHETQNMNCSGGVCSPTATKAVLNVGDLTTMLASGSVTVTTRGSGGIQSEDIDLAAPLSWSSNATLKLDAYRSLEIDKSVSVLGSGGLALVTNDGGSEGALILESKGRVSFANLSSSLSINGAAYTLLGSVQSLASAIAANPGGNYALASDYDAKVDGTYSAAPISTYLTGTVQGLGNTISNLRINDPTSGTNVGLFAKIQGTVSDLILANVRIRARRHMTAGGLAGVNIGNLVHDAVSGSVSAESSNVGGLVGANGELISRSSSSASVSSSRKTGIVGGLVGFSQSNYTIDSSFATGSVTGGDHAIVGGLVGAFAAGTITNSYATGAVSAGASALVGGFVGETDDRTIVGTSYSTGAVQAGSGSYIGGFVGQVFDSNFNDCYWDITSSGTDQGIGQGNASGITGLTTTQFQSELPAGFDRAIWNEQSKVNDGFPYLLTNPPSK